MGYTLVSYLTMPPPMTADRLNGIKKVLTDNGVSDTGAGQIIRSDMVLNSSDRVRLLELLNMVVTEVPGGPTGSGARHRGHGGKG